MANDHSECRMPQAYARLREARIGESGQTTHDHRAASAAAITQITRLAEFRKCMLCYLRMTRLAQDEDVARTDRPAQALDLELAHGFDVDDLLDHPGGALAEQDLVRGSLAAEP